ncbi:MAG: DUF5688 family protein [Roseburia sp.]|nr:DUF5688 family protein [Roseburia sp.]MCM1278329.1 DUF5688 family protein [Robinsoniella sp.]
MTNKANINSLETFALAVKEYLMIEYQVFNIRLNRVSKNNGVMLTGLCIMNPDNNIAPNIYLETFYGEYLNGKPLDEIAKEILRINRTHQIDPFSVNPLDSFDTVKENVVYRLVNSERNIKRLHNIPHIDYMDLTIIFCIIVDEMREGIASITVANDMMKFWDISIEELYEEAHKNTVKKFPVLLKNMEEILMESIDDLKTHDIEKGGCAIPMYVVTNTTKLNGAAVVLYENQLRDLAKCFGGDYFLLPSSIHEILLIPVTDATDNPSDLKEMVVDVNKACVRNEEFLSDSVYRYFTDEGCLRIVA